jgi:hypothetical protein
MLASTAFIQTKSFEGKENIEWQKSTKIIEGCDLFLVGG